MIDLEASVFEQRNGQGTTVPGCVKTASDLARYERLLHEVQPAWIVELGTYLGISSTWLANVAQCNVITIDTHPQADAETRKHPLVTWVTGNSADPKVVEYVRRLIGDEGPVIVICDSDHSAAHVLNELHCYGPLVSIGSYAVVEDGIIRWVPEQLPFYKDSSPLDAVETFLAEYPGEWENDVSIENMSPTTQHVGGWLRKVA